MIEISLSIDTSMYFLHLIDAPDSVRVTRMMQLTSSSGSGIFFRLDLRGATMGCGQCQMKRPKGEEIGNCESDFRKFLIHGKPRF
jgi:hypothetical protein